MTLKNKFFFAISDFSQLFIFFIFFNQIVRKRKPSTRNACVTKSLNLNTSLKFTAQSICIYKGSINSHNTVLPSDVNFYHNKK